MDEDKALQQRVVAQLIWEPRVDAADIGVTVDAGVVTLNGHVPAYPHKLAAENIVKGLKGVRGIVNRIETRLGAPAYDDGEIAKQCLARLDSNALVPRDAIQVKVARGWVTISGQVDWFYQSRTAESDLHRVKGVVGITNLVTMKPRASAPDIASRIKDALRRDAALDAEHIIINTTGGRVILEGTIDCLKDRQLVENACWAAPGVTAVEDHLRIG